MIQRFTKHTYSVYTDEQDEYGQLVNKEQQGEILMFLSLTKNQEKQNPLYQEASYLGLTYDNNINDKYVIDGHLKVLYVVKGRINQVFMKDENNS